VTASFRHAALLRVSSGDTILLASDSPILPDRATIDASQKLLDGLPEIREDLQKHLDGDDVRSVLLPRLLLDEAGLKRLAARSLSDTVNTDLNLRLEFDAPLRLFTSDLNPEVDMDPVIFGAVETPWLRSMVEGWGCTKSQVPALRALSTLLAKHKLDERAIDVLTLALGLDVSSAPLLADRAILQRDLPEEELLRTVSSIVERSPDEALRVAQDFNRRSKYPLAIEICRRILALRPGSATAWHQLALACEFNKDDEKAQEAYAKALELDPLNAAIRKDADAFEKRRPPSKP
jgi:tetratricopeptide (TPR) repeat protein